MQTGCSAIAAKGSYYEVSGRDAEGLKTANIETLCAIYHDDRPPLIRAELVRRGSIRQQYWPLVDDNRIAVGMNVAELMCAWGLGFEQHKTLTARGENIQWVRYHGTPYDATYIYTENGVITEIQN
jgi:hypothetical protein